MSRGLLGTWTGALQGQASGSRSSFHSHIELEFQVQHQETWHVPDFMWVLSDAETRIQVKDTYLGGRSHRAGKKNPSIPPRFSGYGPANLTDQRRINRRKTNKFLKKCHAHILWGVSEE